MHPFHEDFREILCLTELFLRRHVETSHLVLPPALRATYPQIQPSSQTPSQHLPLPYKIQKREASPSIPSPLRRDLTPRKRATLPLKETPPPSKVETENVLPLSPKTPHAIPLEPLPKTSYIRSTHQNKTDFELFFKKYFPQYELIARPLDDRIAHAIKRKWQERKPRLLFLVTSHDQKALAFLRNLGRAIHAILCQVEFRIKSQTEASVWQALLNTSPLFFLMTKEDLLSDPALLSHYVQKSSSSHFLNEIPLFLLPPPSLYFKEPLRKAALWEELTQFFQQHLPSCYNASNT